MYLRKSEIFPLNKTEFELTNVLSAPKTCSSSASSAAVVSPIRRSYFILSSDVPSVDAGTWRFQPPTVDDIFTFLVIKGISVHILTVNGGKLRLLTSAMNC